MTVRSVSHLGTNLLVCWLTIRAARFMPAVHQQYTNTDQQCPVGPTPPHMKGEGQDESGWWRWSTCGPGPWTLDHQLVQHSMVRHDRQQNESLQDEGCKLCLEQQHGKLMGRVTLEVRPPRWGGEFEYNLSIGVLSSSFSELAI